MAVPENPDPEVGTRSQPGIGELLDCVWAWAKEGKAPQSVGRDEFPVSAEDPLAKAHQKLNDYLDQVASARTWRIKAKDLPAGVSILGLPKEKMLAALRSIVVRILFHNRKEAAPGRSRTWSAISPGLRVFNMLAALARSAGCGAADQPLNPAELGSLAGELLRKGLPVTESDLVSCLGITSGQSADSYGFQALSNEAVLRAVELHIAQCGVGPSLRQALEHWRQKLQSSGNILSAGRKLLTRINSLLDQQTTAPLDAGEAWSNAAIEDLKRISPEQQSRWCRLLQHCQKAESSKPTQRWMKAASQLVEAIGRQEFKDRVLQWFELVAFPRPVHQEPVDPRYTPDPDQLIADGNSVILKGLAWACAEWEDTETIRALSRLAQVCFKKVRNLGARCQRVGNACLYSLSVISTDEAAAELTRLNQLVKQPSIRKLIGKSLDKAAELSGQTREDLEESTVPTYGLDANGYLNQSLGDFTAEFALSGPGALQLLWRKADGKVQQSVPAEVKQSRTNELKALKRTLQDLEKMLPAQRQRLERLLLAEREWEFEKWRERYLDHPLVAHFSRRLIWHFRQEDKTASGTCHDGRIVDSEDRAMDWLSPKTRVRLWHPLGQEPQAVMNWRRSLETHQITQPFKQAHREIYILTDAEQQTGTYSNRFAAHIIRQHQFAALAKERGWTYRLQGAFDSHNTPTLLLPKWDLAAEFWVEPPGGDEGTSEAGIYLNLATDQVRFCDPTGTPRVLSEVPALVFSEVMRDLDLFVGVCSIGNDPAWADRGEAGPHGAYWYGFAFGDLSATAKTRRDALERLLPRLKIAAQCTLRDKFLLVRGALRTYKIHLGSSNILMEPNDRYLCIVPDRSREATSNAQAVLLPFEGDHTLAVILSKAFLLADDSKIKDQSILNQIRI